MSKPTYITHSKTYPELWGAVFNKTSPSCPRDYILTVGRIVESKEGKPIKVSSFRLNQLYEVMRIYKEMTLYIHKIDPSCLPGAVKDFFRIKDDE